VSKFPAGNGSPLVRASVAAILGAASLIGLTSQVLAAGAEEEDELEELEEVKVTGTRIQVPGTYTAPNPMTSITAEEMQSLGIVNVADALTTLVPSNISTYTPDMIGDNQAGSGGGGMEGLDRGSYFIGSTIANLRGMDPAFGSRTLTMIDGRRVVSSSNQADVVDMNSIPSNLVQRMDVVTGGASATYGSGAMAGVVNVVLNNRLTGVNVDMDYGVNEAGDGGSPHIAISGGMPFFGGRGHGLLSFEWQNTEAIRNCAEARDWCAESRFLFTNSSGSLQDPTAPLAPLPGFEDHPARFEMYNQRRSQFSPNGAVHHANSLLTTGYRFSVDGTDVEEYAYGYRGGTGGSVVNGDGPLTTEWQPLRANSERRNIFTNFEYNINERTTAYFQGRYAQTEGKNYNGYTQGNYCVRFDTPGAAAVPGGEANPGDIITYGGGGVGATLPDGSPYISPTRDPVHSLPGFRDLLGIPAPGYNANGNAPWWIPVTPQNAETGPTIADSPTVAFNGKATGEWYKIRLNNGGAEFWLLERIHLNADFEGFSDPGSPAQLPGLGRNAYAFLNTLSPEALYQVQRAFGTAGGTYGALTNPANGSLLSGFASTTSGGASTGLDTLYGPYACGGFSVVRKVWDPQIQRWTTNESDTVSFTSGLKGRFGSTWQWDAYYQYGHTKSTSISTNVATNLRLAMAMDAVIDDREGSPTFGKPICRILRDGPPVLDYEGLPVSNPQDLARLAEGCVPINVFGSYYDDPEAQAMQQAALDFAFVDTSSGGGTTLHTLSLNTSGTLWQGWGAGPLTAAFGLEVRENKVSQDGTVGADSFYERADLARVWSDAFGGKSRVTETYAELNMPLVSGLEGIDLWSANVGVRWASYYNKGGAGTTGESATTNVLNWKFSTVYQPFDFMRFRLTRSRDLRAPGYRDLFLNQPGIPDQFSGNNPWRERSAFSDENQSERWGQIRVGNPNLKNEKSDTLTLGMVLSPGGWAQGMRMSVDYFTINMRDAIVTPFRSTNPIRACWEGSGNVEAGYLEDGEIDPNNPGMNGLFDESLAACREIVFGTNPDGSRNLQDIVAYYSSRPENSLPIHRRGVDFSWQYTFPVNRLFENVPGTMSLTIRGTRALEASGIQVNSALTNTQSNCAARGGTLDDNLNCYIPVDMVGQIRSSVFIPGVAASPKWTGNIITSYRVRGASVSLSARYIGGARLDKTWCDAEQFAAGECTNYMNELGQYLNGSVDNNWVDPYFNFALNGSYDLRVANMRQFQVFGSVNNLFDKSPPFTGGGIGGATSNYHDTMGRSYRMGVRMRF
jgi:outer membrane receptor protein involved in Fe transport